MLWSDAIIHVVDFEGSRASGILEYGVATLHNGRVVQTITRLCKPTGRVTEADIAIHRIRSAHTTKATVFAEDWELFRRLRTEGPFAAHFASAENHLLKSIWPYPPASPDFVRAGRTSNEWGPWIDTGRLYGNLFPDLESANLQALIDTFGYGEDLERLTELHCPSERCAYHSALYDALASAMLLLKLLRRPEFGAASVAWLLQMSSGRKGRGQLSQQDLFE
jgi:DNA polymerase III epsilon subunit-like protein